MSQRQAVPGDIYYPSGPRHGAHERVPDMAAIGTICSGQSSNDGSRRVGRLVGYVILSAPANSLGGVSEWFEAVFEGSFLEGGGRIMPHTLQEMTRHSTAKPSD